jgi:hypothetical protein
MHGAALPVLRNFRLPAVINGRREDKVLACGSPRAKENPAEAGFKLAMRIRAKLALAALAGLLLPALLLSTLTGLLLLLAGLLRLPTLLLAALTGLLLLLTGLLLAALLVLLVRIVHERLLLSSPRK